MSGITKLMTAGGGGVQITPSSSIASDVTVQVPSQNCTLGIQGPAFSAYGSGNTHLNAGTWTKVVLDSEVFDTNSNFASSRFTPTISGYYQFNGAWIAGTAFSYGQVAIYKNGASVKLGGGSGWSSNNSNGFNVSGLVYMNGTTDYVELYAYSGVANDTNAGAAYTFLDGCLVRAA